MKKIILLVCCISISAVSFGQQLPKIGGHFSGSFDSYTQWYQKDTKINAILPQDKIGSNNFLKLDYSNGNFSAGIQYESYQPSIAGYPYTINQNKIVNKYFKYTAENFSLQVGDIYEQFGSGLVFRSWENRQIGINNAIEGFKVTASPVPFINLKAIAGRQRKILDYASSNIRGADIEFDFSRIKKDRTPTTRIAAALSYVSRYQQYTGPNADFPATVNAISSRLDISGNTSSFGIEYVHKTKDPNASNNQSFKGGEALLVNAAYSGNNIGINLNLRTMKNFDFRGERDASGTTVPVNYIPALTKQHDYLTTNIYVYNAQSAGETGGQLDVFYNIKNSNNKPSRISLNFSYYQSLKDSNQILSIGNNQYFRDLNIEWKKKWSSKLNTTLAYHNLFYNKTVVEGGLHENITANIAVLTAQYKYAKQKSVRAELQHLYTQQDNGNWLAAVTEFGFAPKYNFFISDLYNYGITKLHYPTIGGSYTKGGSRLLLSYGRQRPGLFCVGGICRYVPAATGITATLSITFNK